MRVALFTTDRIEFPSAQIRIVEPLRCTAGAVELIDGMQLVQQRQSLDGVDLLLFQRSFPRPQLRELCAALLRTGKPVVYETDDDLRSVPEHHQKPDYNAELAANIEWLCRQADLVTVSTEALAEAYRPHASRIEVLPNYLSPQLWHPGLTNRQRGDGRVLLGLVGSKNHDRDFALLADVIAGLLGEYPQLDCVYYGAQPEVAGLDGRVRFEAANYLYEQHPARLASLGIDIALVPLTPSRFNRAKSNIKFLEFGFLGIPGLYADLEPYRGTVGHGENGFLLDNKPALWRNTLRQLIEDAALRQRIGQNARRAVLGGHMLDRHAQRWTAAYTQAVAARRHQRAV